jgi:serine/threonine protein kinase
MVKLCTCRVPRGAPPGACQLCGRAISALAPVSPHAATLDESHAEDDADAIGMPRPDGPPLEWNEVTMVLSREVVEARPEAIITGRYVQIGRRPIGGGSFGEVWKAYDKRLERWVALKLVRVADDEARRAAIAEAKTLGRLRHPHIARLLDAGDVDDASCYLAMDFIDGDTLERRVGGPVIASVRLVRDAALAVHEAHLRGFVHRDLKPRNLMYERDRPDHVFVLDFGLARWISSPRGASVYAPVGTFAYMSPEQASGCEVDARADVYGLATTLYHLLAGRIYPPLEQGDSWMTMARKVLEHTGAPAGSLNRDVDAELDAILARALSKRPEARHATALAFADELARWIDARSRPPAEVRRADTGLVAGRYRVLRTLGQGGFGTVSLALDTHTSAEIVLKQQHHHRNPATRAMMTRSAHIQSRVHHPLIVPVFDFGEDEAGLAFLAMRWVRDAQTFDRVALPPRMKIRLLRDAAAAVHEIHELGYYRLDLKPSNALVTGRPPLIQLVDFDLALHADDPRNDGEDSGAIIGTPVVMSPEQVGSGKPLDRRTDVFSLGATLYVTLAGRYPVQSPDNNLRDILLGLLENRLVDLRAVAPAVDAGLARIVMRCLAYDPADRFPTMLELADALTEWLGAPA